MRWARRKFGDRRHGGTHATSVTWTRRWRHDRLQYVTSRVLSERKFGVCELLRQVPKRACGRRVLRSSAATDGLGPPEITESGPDKGVAGQILGCRKQRLAGAEVCVGPDHSRGCRNDRISQLAAGGTLQVGVRVAG